MSPAQSVTEYRKRINRIVLGARLFVIVIALIIFAVLSPHHIFLALGLSIGFLAVFLVAPLPYIRTIKRTVAKRDIGKPRRQLGS